MNIPNLASWNHVRAFRFSGAGTWFSCAVTSGAAAKALAINAVAITTDCARVAIFMELSSRKRYFVTGSNGWILANTRRKSSDIAIETDAIQSALLKRVAATKRLGAARSAMRPLDEPYLPIWSIIPPRLESDPDPGITQEVADGRREACQRRSPHRRPR